MISTNYARVLSIVRSHFRSRSVNVCILEPLVLLLKMIYSALVGGGRTGLLLLLLGVWCRQYQRSDRLRFGKVHVVVGRVSCQGNGQRKRYPCHGNAVTHSLLTWVCSQRTDKQTLSAVPNGAVVQLLYSLLEVSSCFCWRGGAMQVTFTSKHYANIFRLLLSFFIVAMDENLA